MNTHTHTHTNPNIFLVNPNCPIAFAHTAAPAGWGQTGTSPAKLAKQLSQQLTCYYKKLAMFVFT